ncbi:unnamed protein product [Prunus armeniaca]|uniref:Formin-like protein n=1 Tax=Prunus armeniaca TaxID=36596 RepID=A0A6J5V0E1_PRUAR|nr:unnamed protein product [Prunus armeniaca]
MPQSNGTVLAETIAATAAATLVIAGILFFLYRFLAAHRLLKGKTNGSFRREEVVMNQEEFRQCGANVKGLIVDENGVDVIYFRKLEAGQLQTNLPRVMFNPSYEEEEEERVDTKGERPELSKPSDLTNPDKLAKPYSLQPPRLLLRTTSTLILEKQAPQSLPPPPPQPAIDKSPPSPPPPPPPPPSLRMPPPPILAKRNPLPPVPPPKVGGLGLSLKPPPAPKGKPSNKCRAEASTGESSKTTGVGQTKLKPLHWDKVMAAVDRSMVWDQINDGSFRFDDELMENLFGYTTIKNQSSERNNHLTASNKSNSAPTSQVFILEPRKSQNTTIVLRSLAISRKEIVNALLDGQGLGADTLEKLTKISPTQEEEAKILQFNGNPSKLAVAEAFLFHILKAVPSAFTRFDAMLFRANYDPEVLHLKKSLQTLEMGCKELRARGLFLKLLEAILKAGNRMNAGTVRGNAQGFNLSALLKLSDVKSTDGKTTLLHFVVEQVAQSEGRSCVINQNCSIGRNTSQIISPNSDNVTAEERRKEYLIQGLLLLEGLSIELSNVKKAATIEYESFIHMSSTLSNRVAEIKKLLTHSGNAERGGFAREMKGFLEECEEELKVVREEQARVMELVKRTTEYYQAGALKDKGAPPLQLFVIVKDFLDMVALVGTEISRKLQTKKSSTMTVGSSSPPLSPPLSPSTITSNKLQNFHSHFISDMSSISSSESEDGF